MQPDLLTSLRGLSDPELLARVEALAARERGATAELVAHLAELDTRDVYLRAGHGSLFAYCRDVLGLAEQEAYNRIAVARTARRFPVVLELLEKGSLHLTAVRLLGPHLTLANHLEVLRQARGKSKVQLEEMAAALWPRPDAPSFVRKLPARSLAPASHKPTPGAAASPDPETSLVASAGGASEAATLGERRWLASPERSLDASPAVPAQTATGLGPDDRPGAAATPAAATLPASPAALAGAALPASRAIPPAPARRAGEITPLAPDRYKVQVTIGSETLEKLRLAQDLLRHSVPSGDEAQILDRALTALLAQLAQRKLAATVEPRPSSGTTPGSRRIPSEIRRAVWVRDQGRCAFVGGGGRRCSERAFLEFHHVVPYALGGEATMGNIQLRCRNHNAYEARAYFGAARVHASVEVTKTAAASAIGRAGQTPADALRQLVPERVAEPEGNGETWHGSGDRP